MTEKTEQNLKEVEELSRSKKFSWEDINRYYEWGYQKAKREVLEVMMEQFKKGIEEELKEIKERKEMMKGYCWKCKRETKFELIDEFEGLEKYKCKECGNIQIGHPQIK